MDPKKYVSLDRLSDFLDKINAKFSQVGHKHNLSDIAGYTVDTALSSTSNNPVSNSSIHAKFEAVSNEMALLDGAIGKKADSSHDHNDKYYTKTEVNTELGKKSDAGHNHDSAYDKAGSAGKVSESLGVLSGNFDLHKTDNTIHVTTTEKQSWNAAHSHSTSAHARTDATKVESSSNGKIKINGTDTSVYSHPTSGVTGGTYKSVTVDAQGHITSGSNPTTLAGYGITDAEPKGEAEKALTAAQEYADGVAEALKNELLNGAGEAYDTLNELGDLIDDNVDAIDALEKVAAGKADKSHSHTISDVTGLQNALNGKADKNHGTHVTYSDVAPVMNGTASVGNAATVSRSDHVHPTDTSRASQAEFDAHNTNTDVHITPSERVSWNSAKTHADTTHAPSDAQKNQNAFSKIAVSGQTTVEANTATDTINFEGSNVSIETDVANDKVTFSVDDGSTSTKGVVKLEDSTSSTSTTNAATPNSVKSAYDKADTAIKNAATAQARADAAYSLAESKVDSLADLGITATAAELNYTDGVKSSIQTQLDNKAAFDHTHDYLPLSGGNISGHIYLTGAKVSSSTSNTSQIIFGTSTDNHLALSSNNNALVINPDAKSTNNQIVLYLDKPSVFPSGISGTASRATADGSGNNIVNTYATKTELGTKQATVTGAATTVTSSNLTASRALVSNSSGKIAVSDVTSTELGYLSGAKSSVQTQLDDKAAKSHTHSVADITDLTASATELNYVDGVTSNIQTQLDDKISTSRFNDCIQAEKIADFTDVLKNAKDSSGTAIFNGIGYVRNGKRWNGSDGTLHDTDNNGGGYGCTGFIPISNNSIIRTDGISFNDIGNDGWCCVVFYDSSFKRITHVTGPQLNSGTATWYTQYTGGVNGFQIKAQNMTNLAYITITTKPSKISANPIVTIDQPITYHMSGSMADGIEVNGAYTILTAPNGTKYKLSVSNTGALSAVAV